MTQAERERRKERKREREREKERDRVFCIQLMLCTYPQLKETLIN